jgi:hypothetical protein
MKRFKFVAMIGCFVFAALAVAPQVKADTFDKKTTSTFSEPVEVLGVDAQVLPAGTYVFKIFDSWSDRNIVQIFSADQTHVYTTILAIANYRLQAIDKTVLTFGERAAGQPEAIKAWFYPGQTWGQEFVYQKKRAIELAKIVKEPVLAMPVETTAAVPVETLRRVLVAAIKPTGDEVPVGEVVQAPPAAAAAQAPRATLVAETLPHTASSLPLFALIGVLSLFAGFTLLIDPLLAKHESRLQPLYPLLLTTKVSNKSGNLLLAQSYPQCHENVAFLHSPRHSEAPAFWERALGIHLLSFNLCTIKFVSLQGFSPD